MASLRKDEAQSLWSVRKERQHAMRDYSKQYITYLQSLLRNHEVKIENFNSFREL